MNRMKTFIPILALIALCTSCRTPSEPAEDYCEMAYSDIISELVIGYKTHWAEFSPEDSGFSPVFAYESEYGAFARMDINGDGVNELLLADDFGEGNCQIYDIYTFNPQTLTPVHLLSGGERDSFVLNGQGVIIETGSNSAFESICRYWKIEDGNLKEVDGEVEEDLLILPFEPVLRYVAPTAYVALKGGELQGQLIKIYEDSYLLEVQDTVRIPREDIDIELWSAFDGKGVVCPADPGEYPVYAMKDCDSSPAGTIVYESGYVPDTFKCLGYAPGWFKIDFGGQTGYVREEHFRWDFADRF